MAGASSRALRDDVIKGVQAIKLRAEKQPDAGYLLQNLVRVVDFEALSSSNTQVIYGRNDSTTVTNFYHAGLRAKFAGI